LFKHKQPVYCTFKEQWAPDKDKMTKGNMDKVPITLQKDVGASIKTSEVANQ